MFGKLPPLDPDRRAALGASNMGPRESRFYADLAPSLSFRVPTAYVTEHDDRDRTFVVLLEDLDDVGMHGVRRHAWRAVDAAARALEELAELHVRFEDPARRDADAAWIPEATHGSRYGADLLRYGLDHHRDRLSADFASIAELYIDDIPSLQAAWHTEPMTVVHGDPHLGNLFDDHGRVGFLDWGLINVSSPMRDVSYFLNMSLDIEDRRAAEADLVRHYLDARRGLGGIDLSFDDAWLAHRVHAAYTVPACCQVVTFPEDITPARRIVRRRVPGACGSRDRAISMPVARCGRSSVADAWRTARAQPSTSTQRDGSPGISCTRPRTSRSRRCAMASLIAARRVKVSVSSSDRPHSIRGVISHAVS